MLFQRLVAVRNYPSRLGFILGNTFNFPSLQEMHGMNIIIIRGPTSRWVSVDFCTRGQDRKSSDEFDHVFQDDLKLVYWAANTS